MRFGDVVTLIFREPWRPGVRPTRPPSLPAARPSAVVTARGALSQLLMKPLPSLVSHCPPDVSHQPGRKEVGEDDSWHRREIVAAGPRAVLGQYFPDSPFVSPQVCRALRPPEGLFSNSGILECLPDQTQDFASYVFYQKPRQV